jgi:hypothetical protein
MRSVHSISSRCTLVRYTEREKAKGKREKLAVRDCFTFCLLPFAFSGPSPLNRDDDLVVDGSPGLGKWVVACATP